MNHAGETKLLQANWRITLEIPDCLRQIDVLHWKCEIASGKLIFPAWFFNLPEAFYFRQWNHLFSLRNWMSTKWFLCPPEAFYRIAYWRDTFLKAMERRRLDFSVRLRLFLVSHIEGIHFLKRWSVDKLILLSAWGFFSYHVLKGYISWSDGASTSWFLRPPKFFFVLRIEGIRIRRGMGVRWRRCAVTWDWMQQNKKRSRMRLSSGSLRFSRRHRGALCAV